MRQLILDLALGVSLRDLNLIFIQILSAILMTLIFRFIWKRKQNSGFSVAETYLLSGTISFLTVISRYFLPVAVISAAALLIYALINRNRLTEATDGIMLITILSCSIGCGSGYVLLTGVFFMVVVLPLTLMKLK